MRALATIDDDAVDEEALDPILLGHVPERTPAVTRGLRIASLLIGRMRELATVPEARRVALVVLVQDPSAPLRGPSSAKMTEGMAAMIGDGYVASFLDALSLARHLRSSSETENADAIERMLVAHGSGPVLVIVDAKTSGLHVLKCRELVRLSKGGNA